MDSIDPARWRLINPLLDELLEADSAQRLAVLARIRADDPALAEEVAALLADLVAADQDQFLKGTVFAAPAGTLAGTLAGQVVGNYTLEYLLGEGGMGSVWLAHRSDGRYTGKAAVKFLNRAMFGRGGLERFTREGNLLARLSHPNIAHLIDAGIAAGQPYLVLEYVEGVAIDQWCDTHALDIKARVRLFLEVLAAVEHAHGRLILHRDLKPSNILVTRDGRVKLLDFGVAKLLQHDPDDPPVTQLAGRAFTPEYAAPEQVQGGEVSMATDVYALGVLLYGLLTGAHPTAEPGATPVERMRALVETEPRRPSESTTRTGPATAATRAGTPRQLQRALRGDLDNIIAKALRKVQTERYPTATALGEDLRRFLQDEPVAARPDAAGYRLRKFVRRHRLATGAATATLLALLLGVVGTTWQAYEARRQRDIAIHELTYAEAANEFMSLMLSEGAGAPFTTAQLLARASQSVDEQFADSPELRERLQLLIATQYSDTRDFAQAQAVLLRALASARADGADASLSAQINCHLAAVYDAIGKTDQARALYDAAAGTPARITRLDPTAAVTCLSGMAVFYRDQGDAPKAIGNAQAAMALLASPRPGQRSIVVDVRSILADAYAMVGRRAEAVAQYEIDLRDLAAMGRENTAGAMVIGVNRAVHLSRAGQAREAADAYRKLLASDTMAGRAANRTLEINYANVLAWLGRFPEATELLERARTAAVSAGNPRLVGFVQLVAANLGCSMGNIDTCATELAAARATLAPLFPSNHKNFATAEMIDARLSLARGDPAGARDHLLRSLRIYDASTEKDTARLRSLAMLARVEAQLGDRAALEHAAQAVTQAHEVSQGFAHTEWLGYALVAQGIAQQKLGSAAQARTAFEQGLLQLQGAMGDDAPPTREARQLLAELAR